MTNSLSFARFIGFKRLLYLAGLLSSLTVLLTSIFIDDYMYFLCFYFFVNYLYYSLQFMPAIKCIVNHLESKTKITWAFSLIFAYLCFYIYVYQNFLKFILNPSNSNPVLKNDDDDKYYDF
jgi:hypothetical protein